MNLQLLNIPVELLSQIFAACDDFTQVVALASVCRHLHAVWLTDPATIIWSVGRSQFLSFDDALMAVRATATVRKAYLAGTCPPQVAIDSLSGKYRLPDLEELKEIFNVEHLVRCIEWMYFNSTEHHFVDPNTDNMFKYEYLEWGRYPAARRRFPECLNEENIPGAKNATVNSFQEGFYRAMYRLLLAGAVLARVYMEPMFQSRDAGEKDAFFGRMGDPGCVYMSNHCEEIDASENGPARPQDLVLLRKFPVYNYDITDWSEVGVWRNQEYDKCFGPLASWIVQSGRKRQQTAPQDSDKEQPDWAENAADIGAVRELMLLLVAYEHFSLKFENYTWAHHDYPAYLTKPGNKKVTIVRLGVFQLEEVTMPAAFEDLATGYLYIDSHSDLKGSQGEEIPIQFNVTMATMFLDRKRRYKGTREYPGSPLMLEFWHFALRRYLNLGFKPGMFWMPGESLYKESTWWKEVGRGEIFISPNWAPVQKYKPGIISWEAEAN